MLLLALAGTTAQGVDTGPLTTTALIVIAVFAALVIVAILWGARQKRIRIAGEREEQDRNEALAEHPPTLPPVPVSPPVPAPAELRPVVPVTTSATAAAATPAARAAPDTGAPVTAAKSGPTGANYGLIDVKGLGPKAVPLLQDLGVGDLAALAALDPARAAALDRQLGTLSGRLTRDRWVEQAKLLAAGRIEEFEATYGKL